MDVDSASAAGWSPCDHSRRRPSGEAASAARTNERPSPCRRAEGWTTSSADEPSTTSVGSMCAYPTRSPPERASTCWSGPSPPPRRCSSTCSDSGRSPSAASASATRERTAATSSGVGCDTVWISTPDRLGVSMESLINTGWWGPSGVDAGLAKLPGRRHEPVAHVADRPDLLLVLGPQLGAQPPHVDVDGAGAAEVVVAPDLLQQLGAGEDPAGVLGEVLEQLELLVRQVQQPAAHPGGVGRLLDHDVAGADLLRRDVVIEEAAY